MRAIIVPMGADEHPAEALIARLRGPSAAGDHPRVVGLDGRSGCGKSTLAVAVATGLAATGQGAGSVTVVEGDQFYAGGSAETWDRRDAAEKADRVIDWRRQRDILERLRAGRVAAWHPFDWEAEGWASDAVPLAATRVVARPAPVILLEGAYSCRPELHDLLDLRVLLHIPHEVRRRQLLAREGDDHRPDWDARWSAAEDHYFGSVMTPDRFDLVLAGRPRAEPSRPSISACRAGIQWPR